MPGQLSPYVLLLVDLVVDRTLWVQMGPFGLSGGRARTPGESPQQAVPAKHRGRHACSQLKNGDSQARPEHF